MSYLNGDLIIHRLTNYHFLISKISSKLDLQYNFVSAGLNRSPAMACVQAGDYCTPPSRKECIPSGTRVVRAGEVELQCASADGCTPTV